MGRNYDAIIIGSGIIGCCLAFELAKKGYRTLNVDRLSGAGLGSTAASCAVVRVHYSTLDGTALAWEGYHYWKNWADYLEYEDEAGLVRFLEPGCMIFKTKLNQDLGGIMSHLRTLGIEFEEWDPAQIRQALPIYDTRSYFPVRLPSDPEFGRATDDSVTGAVFYKKGGFISDPQLSTHNAQRAAEAKGAEFWFNSRVEAVLQSGGRVSGVRLEDGSVVNAPVVVNAAGPHSMKINRMAGVEEGLKIKTRALRVEVAHVPAPAGFEYETEAPVISDGDIGCYSRPEVGNHILIGSEDPECDERLYVDPDDYDPNFTEQWSAQVLRMAQRIPSLGIPNRKRGVVDLYDVADDWIPIYDQSDLPGFYLAVGTSGNQFKNAPVVGVMMAELIEACQNGRNHDADPVQFKLDRIGRVLNLGFFSRLREINRESSFSVLG